jgi:small subunit ribosomal protein S8
MSVTDPIADMITRIRNAVMVGKTSVSIPASKMKMDIAKILDYEGFVSSYDVKSETPKDSSIEINLHYWGKKDPGINGLKRISKPGLRIYVNKNEIPKVFGNRGVAVLSTNKGVMTGAEARRQGVGGEVLFYVW